MHLTPEELIDLAEGARAEAAAPHLQSCEVCRHQIAALRANDVGRRRRSTCPSRRRCSGIICRSGCAKRSLPKKHPHRGSPDGDGDALPGSWRAWAMAGVAAAVVISIYVTAPRTLTPLSGAPDGAAAWSAALEPFGAADDPSLALFADLTEQMDPRAITETGWSSHVGAVDEVVASLTDDERLELQRLLKEELAKS